MVKPEEVKKAALIKENENIRFRTFLKRNADEDQLDEQFAQLHKELFNEYDCSKCRNCCRLYHSLFEDDGEIGLAAAALNMKNEHFIKKYLKFDHSLNQFQSMHQPCDFLSEDGHCLLNDNKPRGCKEYPYT
jgi:Fe-S-cluster containining protein